MTRNDALDPPATHQVAPSQVTFAVLSHRVRTACIAGAIGGLAATIAPPAKASGFLNPRVGDPHGHPALSNPYAIYFNPAALGGIQGTQVVVDGTLAYRMVDVERAPSALSPSSPSSLGDPAYVAANTGKAHAGNLLAVPFVAASSDFGLRQFFAGIGAYVPFGGSTKFDTREGAAGNAIDGAQRWSVISGMQRALYTTGAVGFRLPDEGLSFALSGSMVLSSLAHYQARNLNGSDDLASEGRALVEASGVHFSMTAGAFWEISRPHKLRIGASYAIRPGFGEMRLSGTLRQRYGGNNLDQTIDFLQTYPDVIRLGIAGRPWGDQVELRLDGEFVTWSAMKRQCVVLEGQNCAVGPDGAETNVPSGQILVAQTRRWKNAGAVRAGVGFFLDEKTELFGSLGIDTSAVPTSTLESTYPDSFKFLGAIGVRRELAERVVLGASYTHLYYLPATTRGQTLNSLAGASKVPNHDGKYGSQVMFFNVNATFAF